MCYIRGVRVVERTFQGAHHGYDGLGVVNDYASMASAAW